MKAGSYTLINCVDGNLVSGDVEIAVTVLGTVISRRGDTIGVDPARPRSTGRVVAGYGPTTVNHPRCVSHLENGAINGHLAGEPVRPRATGIR